MIRTITLKNFKSYVAAELPLAPLTVLIGANASGKSNALEALRFLSWLAQGQQLGHLQYRVNNDEDRIVRGTVGDLFRFGQAAFTLGCQFGRGEFDRFSITIERRQDQDLHIIQESMYHLRPDGQPYSLYAITDKSEGERTNVRVEYNNFARGGTNPRIPATDQKAIFLQLDSPARFGATHLKTAETLPRLANDTQRQLGGILFLDPTPHKMRESSFTTDRVLRGNGSNLSAILYRLWEGEDAEKKNALLDFVQGLPEQAITDFTFLRGTRGDILLQALESFGGRTRAVDATLLSDGTLRVLAFAAALLTAPRGSLVIIEEIDNGLHPSRANRLLRALRKIADERELSVLISSHNPALLDALPDESIPDVVFCYRDPAAGDSRIVRMADIDEYSSLLLQGSPGELLTKGLIDRYAKSRVQENERVQAGLAWLESIRN